MHDLLTMGDRVARYWAKQPEQKPTAGTNTARKLNAERVRFIRSRINAGVAGAEVRRELAEQFGVEVSLQAILDVWHRRTYGSVV